MQVFLSRPVTYMGIYSAVIVNSPK